MTFANNFDPDDAPQNVGPHLRSKLFDTHIIIISEKDWMERWIFVNVKKIDNII